MTEHERNEIVDRYRHGQCYPMAAALSERLGWPIRTLVVDTKNGAGWRPHVVHAWVASQGRGIDAGGAVSDDAIVSEYLVDACREFRSPRFVEFEDAEAFLKSLRKFFDDEDNWSWYEGVFTKGLGNAAAALEDGLLELDETQPAPALS